MISKITQGMANDTHSLLISASSYLYLDKDNVVRHALRRLNPTKVDIKKVNRKYLDRYVIMDTETGCLYLEYMVAGNPGAVYAFLHRAWSSKGDDFPFCGIPGSVVVPGKVAHPALLEFLASSGVEPLRPASGFASGVHVFQRVSEFENYALHDDGMWETDSTSWPLDLEALNRMCYFWAKKSYNGFPKGNEKISRFEAWKAGAGAIQLPGNLDDFILPLSPDVKEDVRAHEAVRHPSILKRKHKEKFTARTVGEAFDKYFSEDVSFSWTGENRETIKKRWCEEYSDLKQVEKMVVRKKAEDIFYAGIEYHWAGDDRGAMREYRRALELDPELIDAHVHIGNLLLGRHRIEQAESCYRTAVGLGRREHGEIDVEGAWGWIEYRPFMRALHGLGLALEKKKNWQGALDCYLELLKINPDDNQGIRYLVGHVYHRLGDFENAEKCYIEAGDCPDGDWNLVYLYFQHGMIQKAVEAVPPAILVNKYVPEEILHPSFKYWGTVQLVSPGGQEQAVAYTEHYWDLWMGNNSYREFLQEVMSVQEIKTLMEHGEGRGGQKEFSELGLKRIAKHILEQIDISLYGKLWKSDQRE
ncbi:MAG: tetratricopeptide repeat protein [bacterium]